LIQVTQNLNVFRQIQNPNLDIKNLPKIGFHVDVVMNSFAKDRKVMASLGLPTFLETLAKNFPTESLDLSIHLMGLTDDLVEADKFLRNYHFKPSWNYTVFVPEKFVSSFNYHSQIYPNYRVGIWYDLSQWQESKITHQKEIEDFLLMTVVAGKSGQKLTQENRQSALDLVQKFPQKKFLVDGGWSVGWKEDFDNLEVVSYSGFWKEFEKRLNLV
jgi:pentose-5-phosphate-3-epimerase